MIDTLVSLLGYTGADNIIIYICAMSACILTISLAYKFLDFILTLIQSIVGRDKNIKF